MERSACCVQGAFGELQLQLCLVRQITACKFGHHLLSFTASTVQNQGLGAHGVCGVRAVAAKAVEESGKEHLFPSDE